MSVCHCTLRHKHYTFRDLKTILAKAGPPRSGDTLAGLEDHFCGKLLGVPMGCEVCYTNHAEADQDDKDTHCHPSMYGVIFQSAERWNCR